MPEVTVPAAVLYALGAAGVTALFFTSPGTRKANEEAARSADRALQKIRDSLREKKLDPEEESTPKPVLGPDALPVPKQECPDEKKRCPVCGQLAVPGQMASEAPPYVPPQSPPPGRKPIDKETVLARPEFTRVKGLRPGGAQAYQDTDGRIYYRDNLHVGNAAEIEVFDSRGKKHQGTICPNCGQPRGGPESDKRPIK